MAANAEAFAKFGARFIIRGGAFETAEGEARSRNVVLGFTDYETALACYHSPEYVRAKAFREGGAQGSVIVIDGYNGPQPGVS